MGYFALWKDDGRLGLSKPQGPKPHEKRKTVCHRNVSDSCRRVFAPPSRPCTARIMSRKNEERGRDESKLRNHRRGVEGSATRSGSLTAGAAASQGDLPGNTRAALGYGRSGCSGNKAERTAAGRRTSFHTDCKSRGGPNPVMMFVVGLFTTTAMTDNRVAQTHGGIYDVVMSMAYFCAMKWPTRAAISSAAVSSAK
jgi:hypothetical protein